MRALLTIWFVCLAGFTFAASEAPPSEPTFKTAIPALALKKKTKRAERTERTPDTEKAVEAPVKKDAPGRPVEVNGVKVPVGPVAKVSHAHHAVAADPNFSVYFDLLLAYQPGKAEFSFLNFHPLLLFEIVPSPEIQFAFEVNPSPRYYELDWTLSPSVQIRLGKIWVPFDDMNPHNFFGGTVGTSRMRLGPVYFLPDIWADLGVAAKFTLLDTSSTLLEGHLYVVNGFPGGGTDPLGLSADYPLFSDQGISAQDNNNDKAIGARLHVWIQNTVGLGISYLRMRWTPQSQVDKSVSLIGGDVQVRLGKTEFKFGGMTMSAGLLDNTTYERLGLYGELSQKLGNNDPWKVFLRAGLMDPDSRIVDINDTMTIGGGVRYKPGLIGWTLEHYQDVKQVSGKLGYSFTGFRTVIQM